MTDLDWKPLEKAAKKVMEAASPGKWGMEAPPYRVALLWMSLTDGAPENQYLPMWMGEAMEYLGSASPAEVDRLLLADPDGIPTTPAELAKWMETRLAEESEDPMQVADDLAGNVILVLEREKVLTPLERVE